MDANKYLFNTVFLRFSPINVQLFIARTLLLTLAKMKLGKPLIYNLGCTLWDNIKSMNL